MSQELFGRNVQVTIGPKGKIGKLITGIRITGKIEKSLEQAPNPATFELYNLSEDTRALATKAGAVIIVKAGYGDNPPIIYQGDIARVLPKRKGPDIILTVEAGDGETNYQNASADISLAPGALFGQVYDNLAGQFGLSKGQEVGMDRNQQYLQGYSGTGLVRDQMKTILSKQGLGYSIQDNQLQVIPLDGATDELVVVLKPSTGLIGSPFKQITLRQDLAKQGKEAKKDGVHFTSLLNAQIRPGRRVKIESSEVTGIYKVEKVTHQFDTHAQTFYSEGEANSL